MLKSLMKEQDRILQKLADPKEIEMTEEDKINFKNADNFHICEKPLIVSPEDYYDPNTGEKIGQIHENCYEEDYFDFIGPRAKPKNNNKKYEDCFLCKEKLTKWSRKDSVRDHCPITGKYRGAAYNRCNLMLKISPKITQIPVVFHNLRGYDSHLIMQAISKIQVTKENKDEDENLKGVSKYKLSCIPNNTEKYISFSLGHLRFIDSVQFVLTTLDRLVSANKPETFKITKKFEPHEEKLKLLLRKRVYPYE